MLKPQEGKDNEEGVRRSVLRTQRNSSLTLGVEQRVAHAPHGERELRFGIPDFELTVSCQLLSAFHWAKTR